MYHTNANVNLMEEYFMQIKSRIEEYFMQIKSRIMLNIDASARNIIHVKNTYISNASTCSFKNGKYLVSIIDDSVITCD